MPPAPSVWLRTEHGSRGPTSHLTRRDIAITGVAIADRDGLASVTMRSVAAGLATAPASLYRVVDSRDHVIELMADDVSGEFDYTGLREGSGADGLFDLAHQARDIYRRHPWLLSLPSEPPALGPNALTFLDRSLATLATAQLSNRRKLEVVGIASGLVRLLAGNELRDSGKLSDEWQQAMATHLADQTAEGAHPFVALAMTSPQAPDASDPFDRILGAILMSLVQPD
jgi:AcrR family transcriptional regulator